MIEAANKSEALVVCEQLQQRLDLLICDVSLFSPILLYECQNTLIFRYMWLDRRKDLLARESPMRRGLK